MMLSPFTLTSRSPAEQGEKTVSPQVKWGGGGTRLSLRSLTAGFEHNQGFCQGQSQVLCGKGSRGDPKTSLTHGDPDAALSIPGQGQETRAPAVSGSREKGGKKKKRNTRKREKTSKKAPGRRGRELHASREKPGAISSSKSPATPRAPAHRCAAQPGVPARPPAHSSQRWCPWAPGGSGGDLLPGDRASGSYRHSRLHPTAKSTLSPFVVTSSPPQAHAWQPCLHPGPAEQGSCPG